MSSALKNKSVLILEDSRTTREAIHGYLKSIGVTNVVWVSNVPDAMRSIRARTFSVILCDYRLGDEQRNGQQFLEEARVSKTIRHSDVFMMVTGETKYANVMAVAEYAPDDYLLKPFNADMLDNRLMAAFQKKYELLDVLAPLDKGDLAQVLKACDKSLAAGSAKHRRTVERIRAETFLELERYEDAAHCYEDILHEKPQAWAELGLGRALLHLGEFDRSKALFEHVSETHPTYLKGHDFLAAFHEANGDDKSAQVAITRSVEQSPLRLDRQGKLGEIALRNADLTTAEEAFSKIVSHGSGSCFHNPEAYLRLAEIALKNGKPHKAAEALDALGKAIKKANESEHDSAFKGNPVADFCLAVGKTDSERLKGNRETSKTHFESALKAVSGNPGSPFPTNSLLRFVVDCLFFERFDEAEKYLRLACQNSNRRGALREAALGYCPDEPTQVKVRMLFGEMEDAFKQTYDRGVQLAQKGEWEEAVKHAVEAADNMSKSADAQLMASQLILILIENTGWDETRFLQARRYLERGKQLAPGDERLAKLGRRIDLVKKKFGIKNEPARKRYEPLKKDAPKEKRGHDRSQDAEIIEDDMKDFVLPQ